MHVAERLLLYTLSVALGLNLILERTGNEPSKNESESTQQAEEKPSTSNKSESRIVEVPIKPIVNNPPLPTPMGNSGLELRDPQGNLRFKLGLEAEGTPRMTIYSSKGKAQLVLDETGMVIEAESGKARIGVKEEGALAVELLDQAIPRVSMMLHPNGIAEVVAQGRTSEKAIVLRSEPTGLAMISMQDPNSNNEASLVLGDEGTTGLRLVDPKGKLHCVMQIYPDGIAELGVRDPKNGTGASLVRLPDGTSSIETRLPGGVFGASLLSSPKGESMVVVQSRDQKRRAMMRVLASGKTEILEGVAQNPAPEKTPPDEDSDPKTEKKVSP